MMEPAAEGGSRLRAGLWVAGATIARHQLGLCLAMEVQKIICLARRMDTQLLALQHDAEAAGLRFALVTGIHQLAACITANDDLLVLSDGLLADADDARKLLGQRHCVAVQPADIGVAAGFERLDFVHSSAGALRMPGRLAAQLGELPADCDAVSSLTRIALQNGIARQEIPPELRDGGRWRLIRDDAEAHVAEGLWIERLSGPVTGMPPSKTLIALAMRRFGPALLHARHGAIFTVAFTMCLFLIGLFLAKYQYPAPALSFTLAGWLALCLDSRVRELGVHIFGNRTFFLARSGFSDAIADMVVIAILALSAPDVLPPWDRLFVPLVLMGALRLHVGLDSSGWRCWLSDRLPLLGVLIAAATIGWLHYASMSAGLILLGASLLNRESQQSG